MTDEQAVTTLSREIVLQVAPGEVPLLPAVSKSYFAGTLKEKDQREKDDFLGFGVGEAVVMLAPVALRFGEAVWRSCEDRAAQSAGGAVVAVFRRLQARFGSKREETQTLPAMNVEELQYVREVGHRCADNLPLTSEQKNLFVESLIGSLAVPGSSASVTP